MGPEVCVEGCFEGGNGCCVGYQESADEGVDGAGGEVSGAGHGAMGETSCDRAESFSEPNFAFCASTRTRTSHSLPASKSGFGLKPFSFLGYLGRSISGRTLKTSKKKSSRFLSRAATRHEPVRWILDRRSAASEQCEAICGQQRHVEGSFELGQCRNVRRGLACQQIVERSSRHCDLVGERSMALVADDLCQCCGKRLRVDGGIEIELVRFLIRAQLRVGPASLTDEVYGRTSLFAPGCARHISAALSVESHDRTLPRSGESRRALACDTPYGAQYIAYHGGGDGARVGRGNTVAATVGLVLA